MTPSLSCPWSTPWRHRHVRLRDHIDGGIVWFRAIYRSTMVIVGVDTSEFNTEVDETDKNSALNNIGAVFKGLVEASGDKDKLLPYSGQHFGL